MTKSNQDLVDDITKLKTMSKERLDKDFFSMITCGQVLVRGEYKYLDRSKYKGKGRPRISDYSNSKPLYSINND